MTTLVAPADIEALGFNKDQLGQQSADFTAYLQAVIDDAEAEITDACGGAAQFTTYQADAAKKSFLTRAEKYLVSAELWSRRLQFLDSQSITANDDRNTFMLQNQASKNAQNAEARAWDFIDRVTGSSRGEGTPSSGTIETGIYDSASTSTTGTVNVT